MPDAEGKVTPLDSSVSTSKAPTKTCANDHTTKMLGMLHNDLMD